MNKSMIIDALNQKKNGAFFSVRLVSDVKLTAAAKKSGITAYKVTDMTARKGIDYKAQKSVQAKVDAGKVLTHELPWGNWIEGLEGVMLEHKGATYVRLYSAPNKATCRYYLNGKKVTLEELKDSGYVLNSYFNKSGEKPDAMTVRIENVQKIW